MAIASITTWLNDPQRSYSHGRALYEQYGENRVIMALIKSGSGSYHLSKLKAGLEAVNKLSNLAPKQIVITAVNQEPGQSSGKSSPDFTSAPDKILEIRDTKNKNYAEARHLHTMIRVIDSRENRLAAGLQLLDLMDKVNEAWSVIDEWKEIGKVREDQKLVTETEVSALNLADLMKEARNLPTYITKDRQKLEAAKSEQKKMVITLRLEARINRLSLIKKRLEDAV